MSTFRSWVRTVRCLISPHCSVFHGDEYTDYLDEQWEAARAANAALREQRRNRQTGNALEDAIRFSRRDREDEV